MRNIPRIKPKLNLKIMTENLHRQNKLITFALPKSNNSQE